MLVPQPTDAIPNCQYYLTLMNLGDLDPRSIQVKVGDCVYVMREGVEALTDDERSCPSRATDKLDIFRVEQLYMKFT